MRVRQVCAYTFGVQKVKVHFNTPNNGIVTHAVSMAEELLYFNSLASNRAVFSSTRGQFLVNYKVSNLKDN